MTGTLEATGSDFVAGAYVRSRSQGAAYVAGRVQPWVAAATSPQRLGTTLVTHPQAVSNIVAWSKVSRTEFWHDLRFQRGSRMRTRWSLSSCTPGRGRSM